MTIATGSTVTASGGDVLGFSLVHVRYDTLGGLLLDVRTWHWIFFVNLPVGILGGLEWHKNNRDLGFTLSGHDSPGDAFSLDARTGEPIWDIIETPVMYGWWLPANAAPATDDRPRLDFHPVGSQDRQALMIPRRSRAPGAGS